VPRHDEIDDSEGPILPPIRVRTSGRPRRNPLDLSTHRDPSHWETSGSVPASARPPSPRPLRARGAPRGRPPGARTGTTNIQKRTKTQLQDRVHELEAQIELQNQVSGSASWGRWFSRS
jgi:hypothetical protein